MRFRVSSTPGRANAPAEAQKVVVVVVGAAAEEGSTGPPAAGAAAKGDGVVHSEKRCSCSSWGGGGNSACCDCLSGEGGFAIEAESPPCSHHSRGQHGGRGAMRRKRGRRGEWDLDARSLHESSLPSWRRCESASGIDPMPATVPGRETRRSRSRRRAGRSTGMMSVGECGTRASTESEVRSSSLDERCPEGERPRSIRGGRRASDVDVSASAD